MSRIKYYVFRALRWIAIHLGILLRLRVIDDPEYRIAVMELARLAMYVEKSGALAHPRRVRARKEIRNGLREILSQLAVGEYVVALEVGKAQRLRNIAKEEGVS